MLFEASTPDRRIQWPTLYTPEDTPTHVFPRQIEAMLVRTKRNRSIGMRRCIAEIWSLIRHFSRPYAPTAG